jgi:hypothetical protein
MESVARKSKESTRVSSLVPEEIRVNSENLVILLKDYYEYLNQRHKPSGEIYGLSDNHDIDLMDDPYLDLIQKETAKYMPKSFTPDRVKMYKKLLKYYNYRGSKDSVELFFRILFDADSTVYYPWNDTFKLSEGGWDQSLNRYFNAKSFLSNSQKLHDSKYYQRYSYVVKSEVSPEYWINSFSRLVHPAGYIFFADVVLTLQSPAMIDRNQPGVYLVSVIVMEFFGRYSPRYTLDDIKFQHTNPINNTITKRYSVIINGIPEYDNLIS